MAKTPFSRMSNRSNAISIINSPVTPIFRRC
jgi:hypothetical protein